MRKKLTLTVILLFFLFRISYSQSYYKAGYAITHSSDTIRGYINIRSDAMNGRIANFKKELTDAEDTTFYPSDIACYQVDDNRYVSKTININNEEVNVFLLEAESGKISFFYFKESNGQSHYYVFKDVLIELTNPMKRIEKDGRLYEIPSAKYLGTLGYLMKDCDRFKTGKIKADYTMRSIASVVRQYNQCFEETPAYSSKTAKEKNVRKIQLLVGFNQSNVAVSSDRDGPQSAFTDPKKQYGVNAGGQMLFFIPGTVNKFSLGFHSAYSEKGATSDNEGIIFIPKYIDLGPIVKYHYPKGKIRPSFGVGGVYGFVLNRDKAYTKISSLIKKRISMFGENRAKTEVGYLVDLSFNYFLQNDHSIVLSAVYEYTEMTFNFQTQTYLNKVLCIKIGYSF